MDNQTPNKNIVTRFAPSPTGYLHIGGARTALFNYLFAKRNKGKFLLRIEDTDRERSTQAAVDAILQGLDWLGLNADEPPLFQFSRASRHAEVAMQLVAKNGAFKCYCTQEEIDAEREKSMAEGRAFRSPYRDNKIEKDLPFVVRMRAPDDVEEIVVDDKVQGQVKTLGKNIDDMILLRTDGTPTYMLAVVVDDYDMGVTHVIRGDDHLTNAARQSVLIEAMGWKKPIYAHIPLIHGDDGKKLSKRHGALAVGEYEDMGYLPEGILSYLLRLGWSKGDLDIVPIDEAIKIFDLDDLGKSPSRLDFDKMAQVNAHFIRIADDKRLFDLMIAAANKKGINIPDNKTEQIINALPFLKERAKIIPDLIDQTNFIWATLPLNYNDKAQKQIEGDAQEVIKTTINLLNVCTHWNSENLKISLSQIAEAHGVGMGKIGPVIRAALTGGLVAPDLAITMEILGKSDTLVRLEQALK